LPPTLKNGFDALEVRGLDRNGTSVELTYEFSSYEFSSPLEESVSLAGAPCGVLI
jgi:hypothetical protein